MNSARLFEQADGLPTKSGQVPSPTNTTLVADLQLCTSAVMRLTAKLLESAGEGGLQSRLEQLKGSMLPLGEKILTSDKKKKHATVCKRTSVHPGYICYQLLAHVVPPHGATGPGVAVTCWAAVAAMLPFWLEQHPTVQHATLLQGQRIRSNTYIGYCNYGTMWHLRQAVESKKKNNADNEELLKSPGFVCGFSGFIRPALTNILLESLPAACDAPIAVLQRRSISGGCTTSACCAMCIGLAHARLPPRSRCCPKGQSRQFHRSRVAAGLPCGGPTVL